MGLKLAIITMDRVALRTVRLTEAIIVQERPARHQLVLQNAEIGLRQAKNNVTMATKLAALIVR